MSGAEPMRLRGLQGVARTRRLGLVLALAVLAPWVHGCRPDDQRTDSITREEVRQAREDLDPALVAQLDSGNAAMREDDPERAGAHYRRAVEVDDGVAAAWFGIYMSERALGNAAAAEEALERARSLAPGATLLRAEEPTEADPR